MEIPMITVEDETHIYYDDGRIYSKKYEKFIGTKERCGYIRSRYLGLFHRLIYEKFVGKIDNGECNYCKTKNQLQIDHINNIKDDNRVDNLQILCQSCNQHKNPIFKNNKSGIKGVSYYKQNKRWRAELRINGKSYSRYFRFKYSAYICRKIFERKYIK